MARERGWRTNGRIPEAHSARFRATGDNPHDRVLLHLADRAASDTYIVTKSSCRKVLSDFIVRYGESCLRP